MGECDIVSSQLTIFDRIYHVYIVVLNRFIVAIAGKDMCDNIAYRIETCIAKRRVTELNNI